MKIRSIYLLILLFISFGFGCGKNHMEHSSSSPALSPAFNTNWPIFRGDSRLSGIADGSIPDNLKKIWSFKAGGKIKSSPVIAGGKVFIGSDDHKIYALDLLNGRKIWEFKTGGTVEAPPLFFNNTVFAGSSDNSLYALDASSGRIKWKYKAEGEIKGSANMSRIKDRSVIIFGSYDNCLHCLDTKTGKKIWVYETESYINGAPAVFNGKIIFGGCDESLRILSAKNGKILTSIDLGSYIPSSPGIDTNNRAYVGHYGYKLVCADIAKSKIIWEYGDEKEGAPFFSSPAIGDDKIIIGGRDQFVHCVSKQTGKKIWIFRTLGNVDSSPVICKDKVIFGSMDGRIYMVRLLDGKKIWSFEIGSPVSASPAVVQNKLIISSEDGSVYAFGGKE